MSDIYTTICFWATAEMRGGETMIGAEGSAINILVCGSFFGNALLYIIVDGLPKPVTSMYLDIPL